MAGIGLIQLERYAGLLARRKEIIQMYDAALVNEKVESLQHYGEGFNSSGHLYLLRVKDYDEEQRNDLIIQLAKMGISTNVHYKPLPMMTAYKNLGFDIVPLPTHLICIKMKNYHLLHLAE